MRTSSEQIARPVRPQLRRILAGTQSAHERQRALVRASLLTRGTAVAGRERAAHDGR
jgi:hypothetical protein